MPSESISSNKRNAMDLVDRAQFGDVEAKEELIFLFLDWVRKKAHTCQEEFPQADTERLVSSGIQGLLTAIGEYDPFLYVSFKSYAFQLIFVMMDKELQRQAAIPTTLVPGRQKAQTFIDAVQSRFREIGFAPKLEEVRTKLGWSHLELNDALFAMKKRPSPLRGRKTAPGLLGVIEAAGHYREPSADELQLWKAAFSEVGEQGRQVLELRHGFTGQRPMTLRAIGEQFRLSHERIRIIEERALDQFRRRACERGLLDRFWLD